MRFEGNSSWLAGSPLSGDETALLYRKNLENRLDFDKIIAISWWFTFLGAQCIQKLCNLLIQPVSNTQNSDDVIDSLR